ncbi:MAG: histidinol-phosphatase HisJ family protein [Oscillibacter sp.]|jgi:histidinol-phosphatase (PHP family)|nr:histidinol-phosphatase HisJ family protein [Oscillibacter sp.]
MRDFCSVHTHSLLCDGKNTLEEMAAAAFAAGAAAFGASGHSHTELPWDRGCVLPADLTSYRTEVLRLRKAYAGQMDVLLGIEWDSCSAGDPEGFDYWIGSVHNLWDADRGHGFCIDYDADRLTEACRTLSGGNFTALAEQYYAAVASMAARRPTILGHLDLVTKFNAGNRFFDEDSPRYRAAALEALHAADPWATLLEINTGAVSRGYRKTPYPALFLLREWRRMGGRIILTADAHSADAVVFFYEGAAELARAAGYGSSVLLTAAGDVERPL